MANEHSNPHREKIYKTARWLYTRIAEERAVWAEKNDTPMPPWEEVDDLNKKYWYEHAEDMLLELGLL